jgi:hypothetical protein
LPNQALRMRASPPERNLPFVITRRPSVIPARRPRKQKSPMAKATRCRFIWLERRSKQNSADESKIFVTYNNITQSSTSYVYPVLKSYEDTLRMMKKERKRMVCLIATELVGKSYKGAPEPHYSGSLLTSPQLPSLCCILHAMLEHIQ